MLAASLFFGMLGALLLRIGSTGTGSRTTGDQRSAILWWGEKGACNAYSAYSIMLVTRLFLGDYLPHGYVLGNSPQLEGALPVGIVLITPLVRLFALVTVPGVRVARYKGLVLHALPVRCAPSLDVSAAFSLRL